MTEQALDLRTFLRTVWQHKSLVLASALVGVLAGVGYAVVNPPLPTSDALVQIPPSATRFIGTQVVIATSNPVLKGAVAHVRPPMTLEALRSHVRAARLTSGIVSIIASGKTGGQAQTAASAVAESYIDYIGRKNSAVGRLEADVLSPASRARQGSLVIHAILAGAIGLLSGVVIGAIIAVAAGRSRRRLRERDEIAASVRAPVLASLAVQHPTGAAGWMRLLEDYEPGPADASALLRILAHAGLDDAASGPPDPGRERALIVVSLDSDGPALAIGPQLAAFAAARKVPTALVVGPQQDDKAITSLRTACETRHDSFFRRSGQLELLVTGDGDSYQGPAGGLTVFVCVVKGNAPRMADLIPAAATVLAVSAGAATAEQLARIATRSAASGHRIGGVIVTNPDPADDTTGFSPQLARSAQRVQPTRATG